MREYIVRSCNGLEHEIRNVGIQRANKDVQYVEQILLSLCKNVRGEEYCTRRNEPEVCEQGG
jgi:hypothetical protein